jgi:hypothetical protein
VREICVSSPSDNILVLKPLDLRNEAIYPSEIGVKDGAKGFISISNTFTMQTLIRDESVKVKGKSKTIANG